MTEPKKYVFIFCVFVYVYVCGLYFYLYLSKAELWFTMAPHLMVVHGKYTFVMVSLSPPSLLLERCASCFKSNYLGAEWALLAEKVAFQFPTLCHKSALKQFCLARLQRTWDLRITFRDNFDKTQNIFLIKKKPQYIYLNLF